jgi:acyl-CoA dehydrogenase
VSDAHQPIFFSGVRVKPGVSRSISSSETPGFTRTPLKKMGWWASDTAQLHFDNCRVPVSNLIGEEGRGFNSIMRNFNHERLSMSAAACGYAQGCFHDALAWTRERRTFGKRLVDQPVVRHQLVDMAMRIESTRAMLDDLACRLDEGASPVAQIAMLKVVATRTFQFCADRAVQLLGGGGYMRGHRVERLYREVKVMTIGGGAEEIMKDLAARQLDL